MTEFVTADGALLRSFSPEIMEAAYKATEETMNEFGKTNARFKKIYESVRAQVKEGYQWWQVCELPFDTFQVKMAARDQQMSIRIMGRDLTPCCVDRLKPPPKADITQ